MGVEVSAGAGWELRRLIAGMDFTIVGFCTVKEVNPFPCGAVRWETKWANNLHS